MINYPEGFNIGVLVGDFQDMAIPFVGIAVGLMVLALIKTTMNRM